MRRPFAVTAVIVISSLIVAAPASAGQGKVKVACAKSVLPPVKVVGKVRPNRCAFYGRPGPAFVRSMNWKGWGHRRANGKGEWCSARLCMPARVAARFSCRPNDLAPHPESQRRIVQRTFPEAQLKSPISLCSSCL
jgi:hypothetical protein